LPSGFLPFGGQQNNNTGIQTTTARPDGPEAGTFVGPTIYVGSSGGGSALGNLGGLNLETGSGSSELDAAFICKPNYITSRHEDHVVYVMDYDVSTPDFWLKSHPAYPDQDYSNGFNCYASFKTRYKASTQTLKFEVKKGSLAGDAYLAFGNDYGDLERYSAIDGLTKTVEVRPNFENRRRIMMHFFSGSTQTDTGFLAKISVS